MYRKALTSDSLSKTTFSSIRNFPSPPLPGWHRQQPHRVLSVSLGLLRAAALAKQLSSGSERSRSGSSHSTQSVAMGSDPSPATPDSAAARSAEAATVQIPAPGIPRNGGKAVAKRSATGCAKAFLVFAKTGEEQNGRNKLFFAEPASSSAWHQRHKG